MALDLTFKQVRGWFIEKRRRDKSKNILIVPPLSSKKLSLPNRRNGSKVTPATRKIRAVEGRIGNRKKKLALFQDLLPSDYILRKIFRKDCPPLGVEFDTLPSRAIHGCKGKKSILIQLLVD